MLDLGQSLGQIAGLVLVDIAQAGHALRCLVGPQPGLLQLGAQQVAHRLAAVFVATLGDPGVKLRGQGFVERNGEALHRRILHRGRSTLVEAGRIDAAPIDRSSLAISCRYRDKGPECPNPPT